MRGRAENASKCRISHLQFQNFLGAGGGRPPPVPSPARPSAVRGGCASVAVTHTRPRACTSVPPQFLGPSAAIEPAQVREHILADDRLRLVNLSVRRLRCAKTDQDSVWDEDFWRPWRIVLDRGCRSLCRMELEKFIHCKV